jgi:uncharacterized membrane protein
MSVDARDRRFLDLAAILLGLLATAIAAYLTVTHYEESLLVCSVVSGCETVQSSKYAMIGPVPVAVLGLIASAAMLAIAIARRVRPDWNVNATMALFGMALAGAIFLLYLTYLEIWVIEAICQWCVSFLIVMLIWLGLESYRLWQDLFAVRDDLIEDDA